MAPPRERNYENGGSGLREDPENKSGSGPEKLKYFAAFPHGDDKKPLEYLHSRVKYGALAHTDSSKDVKASMENNTTWQQSTTLVVIRLLWVLAVPTRKLGQAIELTGNIWVANGGFFKSLWRLFLSALFLFRRCYLVVPAKGSEDYKTIVGLIDPRTALHEGALADVEHCHCQTKANIFPGPDHGCRRTADVMVMAAKLAYENAAVIQKVVTEDWGMHFVEFYSCWNAFQKWNSTQVFIFTDRPTDAKAVVIAWRGTAAFSAYDWSTDIDFSWCEIKGIGNVHTGFLEALGLADRRDLKTFKILREKNELLTDQLDDNGAVPEETPWATASGLPRSDIDEPGKILAYDDVSRRVEALLRDNPNAKLFVTGHSLGGALAALYTGILFHNKRKHLTKKIAAVYTFGQPRIGDAQFAAFMTKHLTLDRYFRVVYCNDLIPRLPFDDTVFRFKHWGNCFYFNSLLKGQTLSEVPNKNFFYVMNFLTMYLNAVWELVHNLLLRCTYGLEFRESFASILFRTLGLLVPGIGGHSPVNYVNAIRLGEPSPLVAKLDHEISDTQNDFLEMVEMIRKDLFNLCEVILSSLTGKPLRIHPRVHSS